ncbi:MAG: hypothetical protein E7637_07905 [Ruminococcaceae bacterium]|nr:hypothetical protein [Oscillospiraceae bacterium]
MKKKLLLVLACLLVACCVLVGCNKKDKDGAQTTATPAATTDPSASDPSSTDPVEDPSESDDTEPEEVVPEHTHVYGEWVTTTEAGCDTKGQQTKTCACGNTVTQSIASLGGHSYNAEDKCDTCGAAYDEAFGFTFKKVGDTYSVVTFTGTATDVTIPKTYKGLPVTAIEKNAFAAATELLSITIPNSVTSVGSKAFSKCTKLTNATVPMVAVSELTKGKLQAVVITNGTKVPDKAFNSATALVSVTIPDGVTEIGKDAFKNCPQLTNIVLPEGVVSIGNSAFEKCTSLATVYIPASVTTVGTKVFEACTKITSATIPASVSTVLPKDSLQTVVIISGDSIPDGAFTDSKLLVSVTLPEGITHIGAAAFSGCERLTDFTLPEDTITFIGAAAFDGCTKIIETDGAIQYLGKWAVKCAPFYATTYTTLRNDTIGIAAEAFANCFGLLEIAIPDSVKYINANAFMKCSELRNITVGTAAESIDATAFIACFKLENIIVAEANATYQSIDGNLYSKDGKTLLRYAVGKTDISFEIPSTVTTVGDYAFYCASNLFIITVPADVTTIEDNAFYGCQKLVEVYNLSSLTIKADKKNGYVGYYALNIRTSEADASKVWVDENGYVFYEDVTEDSAACYLIAYIGTETDLILPATCNGREYEIYKYAFYYNESLKSVTIPKSVTKLGDYSFTGCFGITSITFKGTVEQWTALIPNPKKPVWNNNSVLAFEVKCSDGLTSVN